MKDQALTGVQVLDLTEGITGPYCTKLFADLGATVIKVERPGSGDASRLEGPFPNDEPNPNASGLYGYLNNNKMGITLNHETEQGTNILLELVKDADVLVEDFDPGIMASMGMSYEALSKVNPKLIMTSITNFGQDGVYRDYHATDIVTHAMSGFSTSIGEHPKGPLRAGGQLGLLQYITGAFASAFTMTSLIGRGRSNKGEHIDVSITEVGLMQRAYPTVMRSYSGITLARRIQRKPGIEKCKDGHIGIMLLTDDHWKNFCQMTEMQEWVEEAGFKDVQEHTDDKNFQDQLDEWLMKQKKEDLIQLGWKFRIPITPILTFEEMLEFEQYSERDYFVDVDHPVMGKVTQPGNPYHLSETPWKITNSAPLLGEHNAIVYEDILGFSEEKIKSMKDENII